MMWPLQTSINFDSSDIRTKRIEESTSPIRKTSGNSCSCIRKTPEKRDLFTSPMMHHESYDLKGGYVMSPMVHRREVCAGGVCDEYTTQRAPKG